MSRKVLIAYFPFTQNGQHNNSLLPQEHVHWSRYLGTTGRQADRQTDRLSDSAFIRHWPYRKWRVQQFYCCLSIRCRGNLFLLSRCRATIDTHTETLTDRRDLWRTPLRWVRVPDVHATLHSAIGSAIQKSIAEKYRQHGDRMRLLLPFLDKENTAILVWTRVRIPPPLPCAGWRTGRKGDATTV
jgi:hypothetical protein